MLESEVLSPEHRHVWDRADTNFSLQCAVLFVAFMLSIDPFLMMF